MSVKPIKCLLIDDDPDDQEIFLLAVKKTAMPVECEIVSSATKGLEKLGAENNFVPNYIFLDLNMPGMDGKMCLSEIRKISHLLNVPVIMYSTSSYIDDIRETRRLGATGFVTKPTDLNVLIKTLREIFTNKYVFQSSEYYQ
jgi:CheY-like chemotaxis protein